MLCYGFSMRAMFVTHRCFGCCSGIFLLSQWLFSSPDSASEQVHTKPGGSTARMMDSNWPKCYSTTQKVTSSTDTGESCPGHWSMDGEKLYYASSVSLKFYSFPSFPFQSSNNINNSNSCYYLIEIIKLAFISSQKFYLFPILFPIPLIETCGVNEWLCGTLEARWDCINADLWIYNSPSASWPF